MSILKTIYLQHLNGANVNMTLDSNGYVGVGTISPSSNLHVIGPALVENTAGNENFVVKSSSGYGSYLSLTSNGNISFVNSFDLFQTSTGDAYLNSKYGPLVFLTGSAGSGTERMRIDTSGRITKPYQPAFCVSSNQGNVAVTAGSKLPFNAVIHNNGSYFNTSTYVFTAPVSGYYALHGTFYFQGGTGAAVCFQVNGSQVGSPAPLCYIPVGDQYDNNGTLSAVYYLNANDTAAIASRTTQSSTFYMAHCAFSGYLIG